MAVTLSSRANPAFIFWVRSILLEKKKSLNTSKIGNYGRDVWSPWFKIHKPISFFNSVYRRTLRSHISSLLRFHHIEKPIQKVYNGWVWQEKRNNTIGYTILYDKIYVYPTENH